MSISARSAIPGRVRWDVPDLLDRPALVPVIDQAFAACPGVRSVFANPVTGRVLLHHDPVLRAEDFQTVLEAALRQFAAGVVPAPVVPNEAPNPQASKRERSPLVQVLTRTPERRRLVVRAIGTAFLDHLFGGATPALIGAGVDIVTRGPASILGGLGLKSVRSQLLALGGIGSAVWTVDSLLGYARSTVYSDLANSVRFDLLNEAYEHLQSLDIAQIEHQSVSEWMSVLEDDIGRIAGYVEDGIDPIITMVTNGVVVAGTFIALSPALAAVQLLTIPGVYLVSTGLLKPIRERHKQVRKDSGTLQAILNDNLAGMPTIVSFGQQETEAGRVMRAGTRLAASIHERQLFSAAYVPAIQMAVAPSFLITLVYGGMLVNRGRLSAGAYNVMGYSTLRLLGSLGRLGVSIEQYQRTQVSLRRVVSLFESRPQIVDGHRPLESGAVDGDIRYDDVVFGYRPGHPVLKGIRLRFRPGKTTGVVGPSGAGKSTLLKLLLRFYEPDFGTVRLDGADIRDLRLDDLRRSIAVVPQQIFLFAGTVRENIIYGKPGATHAEVVQAARIAEAHDFIESLPDGYNTPIGGGRGELSGGQKQRIGIARAVLADRPILLFDEATSAVDFQTEAAIQRSLREFTAGRTSVIIAHRLSTIRHADVIYVLDEGEIKEEGRHDELVRLGGIYAGMWNVQTGEDRERQQPDD